MIPELPLEIWAQIASYISDADLCNLYSVNRYFYEFAMDIRYKELRINEFTNELVSKLDCARTPSVAKRIRYLNISTLAFFLIIATARRKPLWKKRLQNAFSLLPSFKSHPRRMDSLALTSESFHKVFRVLLDVANHMENVQHLHLSCIFPRDALVLYLDYMRQLWLPLAGRISSLSLSIPEQRLDLISGVFPDLSRVTSLSVRLSFRSGLQESNSIDLTSFLNRVAGTLESLSLGLSSAIVTTGFHYLFNNLNHFSQLKHANLDVIFNDATGPDIAKFLNNHGDSITSLSLTPYAPRRPEVTSLSVLQLPALRKLDLSFETLSANQFASFWSGTLSFPALNSLVMTRVFPTHDLSLVGDALRRSAISDQLRHLRLNIRLLHGSIFDALALGFPCLHTLYLSTLFICSPSLPWDMDQFSDEMKDRRYPEWSLYDLTIVKANTDNRPPELTTFSHAAMEVVAKSIPSVQSFCGNGHMDIPTDNWPAYVSQL